MIRERIEKASESIERNLLWGLCGDYSNYAKIRRYLDVNDFTTYEFQEVYSSIKSLYENSGFKVISGATVDSYCLDKGKSDDSTDRLKSFVEMGREIEVDFEGVYNQFRRTSGMANLMRKAEAFGGVENMFLSMYDKTHTAEELKSELDTINKMCFKSYKSAVKTLSLAEGMEKYVKERMFVKDGRSIDFIKKPLLQTYSKGIHVGVSFLLAQSGHGKTTTAIPWFSIPILEAGQKLLSIHNEQEEDEIRLLYLMAYISQVKGNTKKIHRSNLHHDGRDKVTDDQMAFLLESAREFEIRYQDRLEFVFIPRFNPDDLEQLVLEYNRNGYDNVLLDTFKQEDSSDGWEGLDTLAKKMDGISKELGMKIVCTAQLAPHTKWRKYLTVSCIGKAKSIKEVATSMYMFRWLLPEEIPTIKYSYYHKNETTGKIEWKNGMELEAYRTDSFGNMHEKKYLVLFNDKQRKAEDGQVMIYEGDLGGLYFKEVGITTSIQNDDNGR
ncbi:MAG: DnaB-like helicase N-terminal domain-containing protein [Fusobacteriaceae bacterium]